MGALRIAVALPNLGIYGGIRRFLELGEVWTRRGCEVALLTPEAAGPRRAWIPFTGALGSLSSLSTRHWDVLISPDPGLFALARAPGALRVYYSVLERAPLEWEAIRSADLVLANSAGMRRYLARRGISAHDAAGGVNVEFFRPPPHDRRAERARAGGPLRALVYGRLSRRRKGTWTAARAIERAALRARAAVELVLFDARPAGPAAEAAAGATGAAGAAGAAGIAPAGAEPAPALERALRIPHRWVLDPSQRDLANLYGSADIFVSAERRAGWCNTAAEAMACGASVACTRSGTEDFAEDGVTAAVARWPWSWALARALRRLIGDPDYRAAIAARGQAKIQEFSWERTADRIERALESRLGGRIDAAEANAVAR
ncbi:MAG: glycosyltransferase family 4 protein [Candidatus Latescibacteria bacterium]|nr:glycosyltransferase family 4 protein [Candidatus Latescibacterota bacterium]